MFTKLKVARSVLFKQKLDPASEPDVVFLEYEEAQPSKSSFIIATFLAVMVMLWIAGHVTEFFSNLFFHDKATVSVDLLSRIVGGVVAIWGYSLFDRSIHSWIDKVLVRLNITERLAPYFGHRLGHALSVLKGSTASGR